MSKVWAESWKYSGIYWQSAWKGKWLAPMATMVVALVLWSMVNPTVVPFLFFRIQPINDPIIGITFNHNLMALKASLVRLVISSGLVLGVGIWISLRIGKSQLPSITRTTGSVIAGLLLMLSWLALAIMGVPIFSGKGHLGLNVGVSTVLVVIVLPAVFWWWPWRLTHPKASGWSFLGWLTQSPIEKLMMAWGWLLGIAVAEMLAAGMAWTTFSPLVGMLVLSAVSISLCGMIWKAAQYYGSHCDDRHGVEWVDSKPENPGVSGRKLPSRVE